MTLYPKRGEKDLFPQVGIRSSSTVTLSKERPVAFDSPAAAAKPAFKGGDVIVEVDGAKIDSYAQLQEEFTRHIGESVKITVRRNVEGASGKNPQTDEIPIDVAPTPLRRLGLVMAMGDITGVRPGSPAAVMGLKSGDQIAEITPHKAGAKITLDPISLPDELLRLSLEKDPSDRLVDIDVVRNGAKKQRIENVELRAPETSGTPRATDEPMAAPALGIAYRVLNNVAGVLPDTPAAKSGLKPDELLTKIKFIQPDVENFDKKSAFLKRELEVELGADNANWPVAIVYYLQRTLPGTTVELSVQGRDKPIALPTYDSDLFVQQRGLYLEPLEKTRIAESWGEAVTLGGRETWDGLTLVVRFLRKIGTQISFKATGGPLSIFSAATHYAEQGWGKLLVFLTLLSANLAVINALPIPVLDGGHFLFLTLEGIRGKPVSEKVFLTFTYLGFAFILTLMVLVTGLDISRLFG